MYITNALLEVQVSQVNDFIRRVCLNHNHPLYLGFHAICYFCIMVRSYVHLFDVFYSTYVQINELLEGNIEMYILLL